MITTLSVPIRGSSLGLLNDTRSSPVTYTGEVSFRRHKACNGLLSAVTESVDSSLYEVLRVKRNASPNEIRTAYRNLAKIYHPDASDLKQHHQEPNFIQIHNAYATLYDPAERAMYDLKLKGEVSRRSVSLTAAGKRWGVYTSRRWETDQCW